MICIGAVTARSLILVAALAIAGGCNGKADGGSKPQPPASTSTTSSYDVPAVINETYVNRVLSALDQVDGDVTRRLVMTRTLDQQRLRAIYNDPQLEFDELTRTLGTDLSQYKTPPGNRKTTVSRLITVKPDCILLEVEKNFAEVVRAPPPRPPDDVDIITLKPTQPGADPRDTNPTPWSIGNAEVIKRGTTPEARAQCGG